MLATICDLNLVYSMQITCSVEVVHVAVCRYWKYIKLFAAEIHSFPLLRLFQLSLHITRVRLGSNARKDLYLTPLRHCIFPSVSIFTICATYLQEQTFHYINLIQKGSSTQT